MKNIRRFSRAINLFFKRLATSRPCFLLGLIFCITFSNAQTWMEDTFEDFINGTLDASGNNIYVSHDGKVRTIHRFDYNDDGYIDLLFNNTHNSINNVPATLAEFLPDRSINQTGLAVEGSLQTVTADLNKNGYLDLVLGQFDSHDFETSLIIYYGGENGFTRERRVAIPCPGRTFSIQIVGIFAPSYHGNSTRESLPCYLYWGGPDGFQTRNRTTLINNSGSQAFAADFNRNGMLDMAVANHSVDGNHNTFSKIYYNDGDRFRNPKVEYLPTQREHWSHNEDMGNIYNRSWTQTYESSVFQWNRNRSWGNLNFDAEISAGTRLVFEIRSSSIRKDLAGKNG